MKLNFACGANRWAGWENSDILPETHRVDLKQFPYPYDDETAEIVMISHGLAMGDGNQPLHPDLDAIMAEFHRILQPGGWLRIDDNPFRIYRVGETLPDTEIAAEQGRGYPNEFQVDRDELIKTLLGIGFDRVIEVQPDDTQIPCDDETRDALIGNHSDHFSFTLEAQKC